ncbi:MAG TPA: nuclear transport factor 2 family protein [Herpetosiphonaceae bacterium]
MEASIEIKNLYLGLLNAYNTGDVDFMIRYTAPADGILVVGTDPDEWWADHETFVEAVRVQLKGFREAGLYATPGEPQAFVDGRVGWIADRPVWTLPDGTITESRVTAVVRWMDGEWKFVQQHFSLAIRNEDVIEAPETVELAREVAG